MKKPSTQVLQRKLQRAYYLHTSLWKLVGYLQSPYSGLGILVTVFDLEPFSSTAPLPPLNISVLLLLGPPYSLCVGPYASLPS
jgi:hypothetical protein